MNESEIPSDSSEENDAGPGSEEAQDADPETQPDERRGGREEYETETINFMQGEPNEVLAVRLSGPSVPQLRLPTRLAARFVDALATLTDSLGAGLAIRNLRFGSATIDLVPDGTAQALFHDTSGRASENIGELIVDLIDASDDPDSLLDLSRELGERPSRAYDELLGVIAEEQLQTVWRARSGRQARLDVTRAISAQEALGRERQISVEQELVTGRLYLANANAKKFRLDPDDRPHKILGTYPPHLEERIGEFWSKRVRASLRVTRVEVERTGKERAIYELLSIEGEGGLFQR